MSAAAIKGLGKENMQNMHPCSSELGNATWISVFKFSNPILSMSKYSQLEIDKSGTLGRPVSHACWIIVVQSSIPILSMPKYSKRPLSNRNR